MLFSVVIPTYNNLSELQRCLQNLDAVERDDFEVLVGVDGSTDGTIEWLRQAKFHYHLVAETHPQNENRGRSATRNLTLAKLRGTYTLFLDSDMEVAPDIFDRHLELLEAGDTISIGSVWYRNIKANLWVRYTSQRGVAKYPHGAEVPSRYFITPNTALPSRYFRECEGFDEEIRHYGGEDMELGYRINRKFSPRFVYNARARVYTTQPKTLR
ncbi:MAG: glycosyltransferase family A protein, partial [Bacteroidota bacterium]